MKRTFFAGLVLISIVFPFFPFRALAGNAYSDNAPIVGNAEVQKLQRQLKSVWQSGSSAVVKGELGKAAISAVSEIMNSSNSTVVVKRIQSDKLGFKHIRLSQRFGDLPVVGGELIVHINREGFIYLINGKYLPEMAISTEPAINPDTALQMGLDSNMGKKNLRVERRPALVIYGDRLAYNFIVSHDGDNPGNWHYYVDAHTGELILRYNNIKHAAPTGVGSPQPVSGNRLPLEDGSIVTITGWEESFGNFFLFSFDEKWGVYDELVIDWEQQGTDYWGTSDPAAISLANNLSLVQAWVTTILGLNSFDNAGGFARGNVHHGTNYRNAFWDFGDHAFYFGDSGGGARGPYTVLDIVAHEFAHAITDHTSHLLYTHESGALNESYSDIMGVAVEFQIQPDGRASYPLTVEGHSDWLIGEDTFILFRDRALRDISDPRRLFQPSYYRGTHWYVGVDDDGGVHTNSGVQNFAFYLLSEGGSGLNDGHAYENIAGFGLNDALDVAMRANMYYLTFADEYYDSRKAWIQAATDLSLSTDTVKQVWKAVGVFGYFVPDDFPTIQEAIDAAEDDDVIIVRDGTYTGLGNTDVDFRGKKITVRSENGPENCIIDCSDNGRGFIFQSGETSSSVLEGFKIIDGFVIGDGGGIYIFNSSPNITNCIISSCYAWKPPPPPAPGPLDIDEIGNGGGIYMHGSSSVISRCVIAGNMSTSDGGGIFCTSSSPTIVNSNIVNNQSVDEDGGGIEIADFSTATITNCTISGNISDERGGGVDAINGSTVFIINSILWNDTGGAGNEIGIAGWDTPSTVTVRYSDVMGGATGVFIHPDWCPDCRLYWESGNIEVPPSFSGAGDYHLSPSSGCIDSGTSSGAPDEDIDEQMRPCGGGYDMGSDEAMGDCTYSFLPPSAIYEAQGGSGRVDVILGGCCGWTATSSVDWLTIDLGGGMGSGSGTINYSVAANPNLDPNREGRIGLISIGLNFFVVKQYGVTCDFAISPDNALINPLGATGSISVVSEELCPWTAQSNDPWITITSGAAGTGHGKVNYSVSANYSGSTRIGTITIGTENFTITQPSLCFLTTISLTSPANESPQTSVPTFTWMSDACPGDIFAVDIAIPPWIPFWSTFNNLGLQITNHYWTMPENMWNAIPSGAFVYWRVRGRNGYQIPPAMVSSNVVWWFYKP